MNHRTVAVVFVPLVCLFCLVSLVSLVLPIGAKAAGKEETIAGFVVKTEKGYVIEADDGNYLVKGKDVSKMVGKMVEATGIIRENPSGDTIEVKSLEEIQE
ncbi:MAG: hypothetical protein GX443_18405 [Deltaproteobacteria bacterium]|nr:hypothetical protein [Deltaproteobacteria bacterium]